MYGVGFGHSHCCSDDDTTPIIVACLSGYIHKYSIAILIFDVSANCVCLCIFIAQFITSNALQSDD